MKKKLLIIGGMVAVLVIISGLVMGRFKKTQQGIISPSVETKKEELRLTTWEDPAGFKFSYPGEIKIDPHKEDKENYAHLELTLANRPGRIFIWIKDTNYLTIEDWAKKEATGGVRVFDSELGGKPAKKVGWTAPKKLVTATLDGDALVLVEVVIEDEWWSQTYSQILSSFEFIPLRGEPASAGAPAGEGGGDGGVIEEEEEIVE